MPSSTGQSPGTGSSSPRRSWVDHRHTSGADVFSSKPAGYALDYLAGKMWRACNDSPAELEAREILPLQCKTRTYRLRTYVDVFLGSDAVAWLAHPRGGALSSETEALEVGNTLLEMGFFDHVCSDHGLESKFLFYRWLVNPLLTPPVEKTRHHLASDYSPDNGWIGTEAGAAATISRLEKRIADCENDARRHRTITPLFVLAAVVAGANPTVWYVMVIALLALAAATVQVTMWPSVDTIPTVTREVTRERVLLDSAHEIVEDLTASYEIVEDPTASDSETATDTVVPEPAGMPILRDSLATAAAGRLRPNRIEKINSEHFEGSIAFLIRTDPLAPLCASYFTGKRRLIELQVQGRFKTIPRGPLFMGGELIGLPKMNLNAVWRGIAWGVLKAIRALSPGDIHYSFGTETERPNISSTAMNMLEKVIVTPPGGKLPPLGKDIPEDPVVRKSRRRASTHVQVNTTDTYTFAFHTAYADLIQWRCANLPGVGSLDLHRFWGDASFALMLYDCGSESASSLSHAFSGRRDYFRIEIAENTENR